MIGIIDYNAGNLRSVANALDRMDKAYRVCAAPVDLDRVKVVVLPGVGQFASASRNLRASGLFDALQAWASAGRPIVGICLGLQLLFELSEEAGDEPGLGIMTGRVVRLKTATIPHMGWNRIVVARPADWVEPVSAFHYYFAHGFVAEPAEEATIVATTNVDGSSVASVIATDTIRATQFHPEKSGAAGARLLAEMLRW